MPGLQHRRAARAEDGRLELDDADAVQPGVEEGLAETRVRHDAPALGLHGPTLDARAQQARAGLLGPDGHLQGVPDPAPGSPTSTSRPMAAW